MVNSLAAFPLPAAPADSLIRADLRPDTTLPAARDAETSPDFSARLTRARTQHDADTPSARKTRTEAEPVPRSQAHDAADSPEQADPSAPEPEAEHKASDDSAPQDKGQQDKGQQNTATKDKAAEPAAQNPPGAQLLSLSAAVVTPALPIAVEAPPAPAAASPPASATLPGVVLANQPGTPAPAKALTPQTAMDSNALKATAASAPGVAPAQTEPANTQPMPAHAARPTPADTTAAVTRAAIVPTAPVEWTTAQPVTPPSVWPATKGLPMPGVPIPQAASPAEPAKNAAAVPVQTVASINGANTPANGAAATNTAIAVPVSTRLAAPVQAAESTSSAQGTSLAKAADTTPIITPNTAQSPTPLPAIAAAGGAPRPAATTPAAPVPTTATTVLGSDTSPASLTPSVVSNADANPSGTETLESGAFDSTAPAAKTPTVAKETETVAATPEDVAPLTTITPPAHRLHTLERVFSLNAPAQTRAVAAPWQENLKSATAITAAPLTSSTAALVSRLATLSLVPPDAMTVLAMPAVLKTAQVSNAPLSAEAAPAASAAKSTVSLTAPLASVDSEAQSETGAQSNGGSTQNNAADTGTPNSAIGSTASTAETTSDTRTTFHAELNRTAGSNAAERAHVMEQVTRHLDTLRLERGHGEMTLQLSPQHLGSLRITLQHQADGVTARILTETPQAQQALQASRGELRAALESKGYVVQSLDVSVGQGALGDRQAASQQMLPNAQERGEQIAYARALRGSLPGDSAPDTAIHLPAALVTNAPTLANTRLDYRA